MLRTDGARAAKVLFQPRAVYMYSYYYVVQLYRYERNMVTAYYILRST